MADQPLDRDIRDESEHAQKYGGYANLGFAVLDDWADRAIELGMRSRALTILAEKIAKQMRDWPDKFYELLSAEEIENRAIQQAPEGANIETDEGDPNAPNE